MQQSTIRGTARDPEQYSPRGPVPLHDEHDRPRATHRAPARHHPPGGTLSTARHDTTGDTPGTPGTAPEAQGARGAALLPALSEEVTRSLRALHALKAQIARADGGADSAAHTVLLVVAHHGAQRVGALAERIGTDPSTVSRQTGDLVRRGLLERQRDPDDGRACRVAVTPAGRDVVAATLEHRQERLARAVDDWDDDELGTFVSLMARFADGLERARGDAPAPPAAPPTRSRTDQETA
ncbi:MarR family winged helix-turn-helix transcriptional regulator [Kineococcus sp. SYSU DK018]|uniref:MarR family winged helix-turn-helix transcriptional regulator n=1 Tax=Kineococcus sp. SYSU DK018 TaxID=3383139 RepID=UPI003D7EA75D